MSLTTTHQRYARRVETLWRDTGLHVLALAEDESAEVTVLSGGSAIIWRLLEEPLTAADIVRRVHTTDGAAPPDGEVQRCLDELVARGLIDAEGSAE